MPSVEIENLSFSYPGNPQVILQDVSMTAGDGEFICVLGQSGCGKSTLLRLLAGLEKPVSGALRVDGVPIAGASLDRGVVFQDYSLFPWMTAGDNLLLALKKRFPGKKKAELKEIALSSLRDVGLGEDAYKKLPKELSGGMQQRVAIAQVFSTDPSVLLMDEPFGALDAVTRAKLQDLIARLCEKARPKKTVFFVTHDVDEAMLLADRVVVLGQSPSRIIYEHRLTAEEKATRENQFDKPETLRLRNRLISELNRNITGILAEDPTTGIDNASCDAI